MGYGSDFPGNSVNMNTSTRPIYRGEVNISRCENLVSCVSYVSICFNTVVEFHPEPEQPSNPYYLYMFHVVPSMTIMETAALLSMALIATLW